MVVTFPLFLCGMEQLDASILKPLSLSDSLPHIFFLFLSYTFLSLPLPLLSHMALCNLIHPACWILLYLMNIQHVSGLKVMNVYGYFRR